MTDGFRVGFREEQDPIAGFLGADVPPPAWHDVESQPKPSAAPETVEAEPTGTQIPEPQAFHIMSTEATIHRSKARSDFEALPRTQRVGIVLGAMIGPYVRPYIRKSVGLALVGAMVPGGFIGYEISTALTHKTVATQQGSGHDMAIKPFGVAGSPAKPTKPSPANLPVPTGTGACSQPLEQISFYASADVAIGVTNNNGTPLPEQIKNDQKTPLQIKSSGPMGICETPGSAISTTHNSYTIDRSLVQTQVLFPALDKNCNSSNPSTDKECVQVASTVQDKQLPASEITRLNNMILPGGSMHVAFLKALDKVFRSSFLDQISAECGQNITMVYDQALSQWVQAAEPGTQKISFNGNYNSLSKNYDQKTSDVTNLYGITLNTLQVSCTPTPNSGGQQ